MEAAMNRRQVTMAMAAGTVTALGGWAIRAPGAMAGGWAALELVNPPQVAVVGVPLVVEGQILQHGVSPNPDFGASIRFTHEASGEEQIVSLAVISRALALARGEVTPASAGTWQMQTWEMGVDVEIGTVEAVDAGEGEVISQLWSPVAALACGEGGSAVVETDILSSAFADPLLEVASGTTVTWTNTSGEVHQVTFHDDALPASDLLRKSDTFSVTFDAPGEFSYFCAPHPHMTGVVKVTAAS
jgi:plastocyanin